MSEFSQTNMLRVKLMQDNMFVKYVDIASDITIKDIKTRYIKYATPSLVAFNNISDLKKETIYEQIKETGCICYSIRLR